MLLRGVNDSPSHARELARLLRGRRAHVNLIPFNDVAGLPYRRPTDEALAAFVNELEAGSVSRPSEQIAVQSRHPAACAAVALDVFGGT